MAKKNIKKNDEVKDDVVVEEIPAQEEHVGLVRRTRNWLAANKGKAIAGSLFLIGATLFIVKKIVHGTGCVDESDDNDELIADEVYTSENVSD